MVVLISLLMQSKDKGERYVPTENLSSQLLSLSLSYTHRSQID
jgi:hypothetical protein